MEDCDEYSGILPYFCIFSVMALRNFEWESTCWDMLLDLHGAASRSWSFVIDGLSGRALFAKSGYRSGWLIAR